VVVAHLANTDIIPRCPTKRFGKVENRPDTARNAINVVSANLNKPSQIPTRYQLVTVGRYVLLNRHQRVSLWEKQVSGATSHPLCRVSRSCFESYDFTVSSNRGRDWGLDEGRFTVRSNVTNVRVAMKAPPIGYLSRVWNAVLQIPQNFRDNTPPLQACDTAIRDPIVSGGACRSSRWNAP